MAQGEANGRDSELFVDAHVHVYPFMSIRDLLDAARRNLFANHNRAADGASGLLLVADPHGIDGFERLLACADDTSSPGNDWRCESSDRQCVTFSRSGGTRIVAIRGQQLVTSEGLEVLGVGYSDNLPPGVPLAETLRRIRAAGGWSIIAWGAGKWTGRRGELVTRSIENEAGRRDVMLGDNGGRPRLWSRIPQFAAAAVHGMRILPGTDPLPLRGEERRVGSYGFRTTIEAAGGAAIADSLLKALNRPETPVETFGELMPAARFVSNQVRLRLRNEARVGQGQ